MKKLFLFLILTFTTLNVYAKWAFIGSTVNVMTYGIDLIRSYDPTKVGCSSDDFYDGMHPKDKCVWKRCFRS